MLSDESTSDSDNGIRFKTDSIRKNKSHNESVKNRESRDGREFNRPERNRGSYGSSGDRNRQSRKSPPKSRERSPYRNTNWNRGNDRFTKEESYRSQRFTDSLNRDRSREKDRSINRDERNLRDNSYSKPRDRNERSERERDVDRSRDKRSPINFSREFDHRSDYDSLKDRKRESNQSDIRRDCPTLRKEYPSRESNRKYERQSSRETSATKYNEVKSSSRDVQSKSRSHRSPIKIEKSPYVAEKHVSNKTIELSKKPAKEPSPKHPANKHVGSNINNKIIKSNNSDSEKNISDPEPESISYYNMVSEVRQNVQQYEDEKVHETIHVPDSSEDEATLQRKLLLLENELKKTKKKTKHKEKKLKKHKKTKRNKSPIESNKSEGKIELIINRPVTMQVTINSTTPNLEEKRVTLQNVTSSRSKDSSANSDDSNEEGEILSDSDDHKTLNKSQDLRSKLDKQMGPSLPDSSYNKTNVEDLREKLSTKADSAVAGPALPPHMRRRVEFDDGTSPVVEGPALPPHLKKQFESKEQIGPSISTEMRIHLAIKQEDSESDDDVLGPMPVGSEKKMTEAQRKLEERALKMKMSAIDDKDTKQPETREEWMLELPDAKAKHIGFGPRQFRTKEAPDLSDRSSWTDTPEQKAMKAAGINVESDAKVRENLKRNAEAEYIRQRDIEQEEAIKKNKKKHKRDKSLLELHQKEADKKKKKEPKSDSTERRPFDRDIDLKANRFDEAQKKTIMKKAQLLDTRFSSGESKFL